MELGALICKPKNPLCNQCPISKKCTSFIKKDFNLTKVIKKNRDKYFLLKVYKRNNKYLLVKNNRFNFLKNLNIFPMKELIKPKNFKQNMSFKMSNMNMSVKIEYNKMIKAIPYSYWIDPKNLKNYTLPTFTKKIVKYLENHK
jgi:A/G-specific adenine glycosylase